MRSYVHPSSVTVREPSPWYVRAERASYGRPDRVEIVRETVYGTTVALTIPVPEGCDPVAVAGATSMYTWHVDPSRPIPSHPVRCAYAGCMGPADGSECRHPVRSGPQERA